MNNRVRALESLIAIFLLGLVIGAGGALLWVDRGPQNADNADRRSLIGGNRNPVRLSDLLHLTPEQDAQIKAIYDETRRESAALSKEMGPKLEAIRTKTNSRIAALLDDEQNKIFEQFLKERDLQGRDDYRGGGNRGGGREGGSQQPGPDRSGRQQSQPPGLGRQQFEQNPSNPQPRVDPSKPQQKPSGEGRSVPETGPAGSKSPSPAGASSEREIQSSS